MAFAFITEESLGVGRDGALAAMGGPIVAILGVFSVGFVAIVLPKLFQFAVSITRDGIPRRCARKWRASGRSSSRGSNPIFAGSRRSGT